MIWTLAVIAVGVGIAGIALVSSPDTAQSLYRGANKLRTVFSFVFLSLLVVGLAGSGDPVLMGAAALIVVFGSFAAFFDFYRPYGNRLK